MVLNETFGETGTAATFFGGSDMWFMVGLLLLAFFLVMLMGYNVSGEAIAMFLVIGILTIGVFQLFYVNEQLLQTVLFVLLMFFGYLFYLWVSR